MGFKREKAKRREFLGGIPRRDGRFLRVGRWWYDLLNPFADPIPVIAGGTTAAFTQTRFRFRNDDGSQTTATFKAAEDTNILVGPSGMDVNIRLRIQVDETAGGTSANFIGQLRLSRNGGAYAAVTGSTTFVRAAASAQFTDEAATTAQLTAATGTFLTGAMDEADGAAGTTQVDFLAGQYTEFEWCFQVRSADVVDGDTLDFRCYNNTTVLNAYTQTARITITSTPDPPAGTIAVTGQAPVLKLGLLAAVGAIALTGQAVGVAFQGPATGSIDITGLAPTLTVTSNSVAQPPAGTIAVTGQPPVLLLGQAVPAGSISITGLAPSLSSGIGIGVPAGAVALTGQAPVLKFGLAVPVGAIAVTGQAPGASAGGNLAVPAGAIAVTGQAPGLRLGIGVPVGSITVTGAAPTSTTAGTGTNIAVPTGAIALTGQNAGVAFQGPSTGSIALTGLAPALSITGPIISIAVPAGSITVSGNYVAVSFRSPDAGAITITGHAPQVLAGLHVPAGAIALTGQAPTISISGPMPVGSIALVGRAPTLSIAIRVPMGGIAVDGQLPIVTSTTGMANGVITITGLAPTLRFGVAVPQATVALTGAAPVLGYGLPVPVGTITVTGAAPGVGHGIAIPVGAIALTGNVPGVVPPGPIPVPVGEVALTGQAPTLSLGIRVSAGSISIDGYEPSVGANIVVVMPAGEIALTGLTPAIGAVIRVPVGSITVTGLAPTSSSGDAPTNQTALTALNLRPFGIVQSQQVDDSGATYPVWYYFIAEAGDKVINVTAYGDALVYRPVISIWVESADPEFPDPWLDIFAQNRPLQFPVVPGTKYYVRVQPNVGNPAPANLTIVGRSHVELNAPAGSILINNDTGGFESAILDATTGEVLRFLYPFPAGEAGDILPTGEILVSDEFFDFDLKLYESDGETLIAEGIMANPLSGALTIRAQRVVNKFYVSDAGIGATPGSVITVNRDGTVGATTWTLPAPGVTAIAASNDEAILYLSGQLSSLNSEIKRWDLVNSVFLTDLVGPVADHGISDLLVLADETIVALYFKQTAPRAVLVGHYTPAGATLGLWTIGGSAWDVTQPRMNVGLDDPDSVWLLTHPSGSELGFSRLYNISTVDGSTIDTWLSSEYEGGQYLPGETDSPVDYFGNSFSCPLMLLQVTISDEVIVAPEDDETTIDGTAEASDPPDSICVTVFRRLGDPDNRIWSNEEIDNYLLQAVREMCTYTRLVWDWVYPENLPRGFSYNQPWELEFIDGSGHFDTEHGYLFNWLYGQRDGMGDGQANYTFADERRYYPTPPNGAETRADEDLREGWARHTFPDEIPFLDELGSDQQHATSDLPHRLTELERSLWDKRTIDATAHRFIHKGDTRYEIESGEVNSYTWRKDGVRTFRKIRVPNELASTYEIDGLWGIARDVEDVVASGVEMEGTWGIPRIVPGHHPIGPFFSYRMWGTVRRFYQDRKNVRVEHWRTPFLSCLDSELPPRYRHYLVYYAMWRCLTRQGPGQDFKLGGWYKGRWDVALARIKRRIDRQNQERTGRMGGPDGSPPGGAPPRPRLPWQYGSRLR